MTSINHVHAVNNLEVHVIAKAKQIRESLGGTLFAFPIEESNPFSAYAVVMYAGGKYITYPDTTNLSEASAGILLILKELKKRGLDANYERNVRIISYQAQMDSSSTVMHKLKNFKWKAEVPSIIKCMLQKSYN